MTIETQKSAYIPFIDGCIPWSFETITLLMAVSVQAVDEPSPTHLHLLL